MIFIHAGLRDRRVRVLASTWLDRRVRESRATCERTRPANALKAFSTCNQAAVVAMGGPLGSPHFPGESIEVSPCFRYQAPNRPLMVNTGIEHDENLRLKRRSRRRSNKSGAPIRALTTLKRWNAASDDWHTTAATVDLREGGTFSSRMEAKDGSMGFRLCRDLHEDRCAKTHRITSSAIERPRSNSLTPKGRQCAGDIDAEATHSIEQQRGGWQAILNNFARYVERSQ